MEEAWIQQNLSSNHKSILLGRFDLNAEFYRLQPGGDTIKVESNWKNGSLTGLAQGGLLPNTAQGAYFTFFNPNDPDLLAKVIDGRAINQRYWLFTGGLSNVEYWVTFTDIRSGGPAYSIAFGTHSSCPCHRIPAVHVLFAVALTITSLQGHWIAAKYADALAKMRSPSQADKVDPAIAMTIKGNRADVTSFHEGSWRMIKSVDEHAIVASPLEDPDGKGERLPMTVTRDEHGAIATIRVALWPEALATFRRIDVDAETYARRVLLAGTYRDAKGLTYVFTEGGQLTVGKGPAKPYQAALDTSEACCDYFIIGEEDRVGFQWKDGKLLLYKVIEDPNHCPISCAKTPYAVLTAVH